ncbi:O-sialoglycoprotein endopeptidase [Haloarcula marismortui ATCC 43049]|uniref:Probable bifunctional tRNA threonylcarbamoyladenosine biosynthesis protein n=2 Tax=Haloarcula marismortui (strain ATCC 43049 / DSM 3752 / JCM 8966 / VKM B-1809) TaxID=272569 RepID=KAE1B_HALMA|nr:bifunctional N(6)-L-threonylcarbamoyladenine synthase/serine/threonine protein kinase [Haloarcula marismortui]P36174.2 RecName: Full=Probable bifunctional tRNA threonylcarbamoyladenosine biosynthesis protein; Includes: RecName: Full=tRNA N6-adenosine threonylcarbamoyltransferase; AltName: Full=N6-L-threonylcarbamoyladenine synthase; Short=t(6)A synthase; AltName: Full=t(6)A37 threonylcarbamoyladenosine biosynthesis protein Kae1; AltName: Full=tRNA threonylcarbamoyladenosine biosynthesis protein
MRILGIEGTAWAASASVFETPDPARVTDDDHVFIETDAYAPDSGGIHPREAAEHMGEAIPTVVETAIEHTHGRAGRDGDDSAPIDAVAFARGPGLGPCLRIVATAARAVAQRFDVPLVGVNHMVAHLEVGRHRSGFDSPVCLNASGANAHILGYRNGRYRVLGETMDTGVGNAIDKFTRHIGWSHPGGPKVEQHARDGEYHELPYVVKGMDFSFSGIMSAAKQAVDDGVPVENVCRGMEETIFAMLTEVSERALSLTGADELVLGGGVGQNARLQRMLGEMCEQREAEFYAPENRFLRDNAGMIAMLGAKMYAAGDTIAIEDSRIDSNFRPDEVAVTWRGPEESVDSYRMGGDEVQGAEATVHFDGDRVIKVRVPRSYRHPTLDERLRTERTRQEARLTSEARRNGVPTPLVRDVDPQESRIVFQRVGDTDLREGLSEGRVADVGRWLARIHDAGFVHGDPTTRNVRVGGRDEQADRTTLIDFGLGYYTQEAEDHAMDLHVLAQSLAGTADDPETLLSAAEDAYRTESDHADAVFASLDDIEGRGRYQ